MCSHGTVPIPELRWGARAGPKECGLYSRAAGSQYWSRLALWPIIWDSGCRSLATGPAASTLPGSILSPPGPLSSNFWGEPSSPESPGDANAALVTVSDLTGTPEGLALVGEPACSGSGGRWAVTGQEAGCCVGPLCSSLTPPRHTCLRPSREAVPLGTGLTLRASSLVPDSSAAEGPGAQPCPERVPLSVPAE